MSDDRIPGEVGTDNRSAEPGRPVAPRHRRRLALLFSGSATVVTTAVVAALDTKLPPYKGD